MKKLLILSVAALSIMLAGCNSNDISFVSIENSSDNSAQISTSSSSDEISSSSSLSSFSSSSSKQPESQLKKFENITFSGEKFKYDGKEHSIFAKNVPEFAEVDYIGNGKINPGEYTVSAYISAPNYEKLVLTAKMTIEALEFEGITFEDQTFEYDGKYHSIYAKNVPSFANVSYSKNNDQKDRGVYPVTATITATGYKKLTLTANLIISKCLPKVDLPDRTLIYNGQNQFVAYELPDNLPRYTEIILKVDGRTVENDNEFTVKTVGKHTVSVTLTNTEYGYDSSTTTATVEIIKNTIGGVDTTKSALKITKDLKYKTLRSKILEGNFTIKEEYFDDYFYPDGRVENKLSYVKMTYAADGEVFEFYYDASGEISPDFYFYNSYYRHTTVVNNEIRSYCREDGIYAHTGYNDSYILSGEHFNETIIAREGLKSMAYLNESENGGFEDGQEGNYSTNYGSFTIDEKNNCFIEDVRAHYYHSEFDHDEHSRYTIYNIGNTTINVPDLFNAKFVKNEEFEEGTSFYLNGFYYNSSKNGLVFNTVLDAVGKTFLEPGEYILPATINGVPVYKFDNSYYANYYDQDCSGYIFKVYFDSYGNYQGEYENLGRITNYSEIYKLTADGATVKFYGEW